MLLAEPRPLRIVKWTSCNLGFHELTLDPDINQRSFPRFRRLHPAQTYSRGLGGRISGTGYSPRGSSIHNDGGAIVRYTGTLHHQADQALSRLVRGGTRKQSLAHEIILVELDGPAHVRFIRVGESVGINTHDNVALFKT